MEKEKKKTIILSVVAITTLALLVVGATYAYFTSQGGDPASANVSVTTYTTDVLTFAAGDDISIYADQESFASGKGNATGSTYAKAMLTANNKTNTATEHYYVYLNITNNEFIYTIDENTPELILTVTDSSGYEITDISGLNHVSIKDGKGETVSGYDITEASGLLTLFNNREITASPSKEEQWNIKLTFVNYEADQNENAGYNFTAKIIIQKENFPNMVSDVCKDGDNLSQCIVSLEENSFGSISKLYLHDSNLLNGAGDNSYRFSGGDYKLSQKAISNNYPIIVTDDTSVDNSLINYYCMGIKQPTYYDCYDSAAHFELAYDSTKTNFSNYLDAVQQAITDGYIELDYVNNYVCFGSNEETCPTDNLYRIIGLFDGKIKLIKYNYATSALLGTDGDYHGFYGYDLYYWNKNATTNGSTNTWSDSLLNKVNLNTNFITNIGETWANKIATTTWKVGGNTPQNIYYGVPSSSYYNEIIKPDPTKSTDNATEYNAKIGLMYVSDYEFAVDPSAWTDSINNSGYTTKAINWMYNKFNQYTITRLSSNSNQIVTIGGDGNVWNDYVYSISAVRPTFYLESSVTFADGDGTLENPIRLGA